MDLHHLREAITTGLIDVGVLIVANAKLARFLTDRAPQLKDAERHIKHGFECSPCSSLASSTWRGPRAPQAHYPPNFELGQQPPTTQD